MQKNCLKYRNRYNKTGSHTAKLEGNRFTLPRPIKDAKDLILAGADIVAFDGTSRPRGENNLKQIIKFIKINKKIAMADIATLQEGINARLLGADIVSTTLSGYDGRICLKHLKNLILNC